jgi:hypothetical protein
MLAIPLKPEYGPTLGQMLSPRWRRASRSARAAVVVAAIAFVALVIGAVLTLEDARLSYSGPVSFNFLYKDLYRAAPDAGGYAKVERHSSGRVTDSFAVESLRLPPYSGSVSGELPLYASTYLQRLAGSYPSFDLQGETKTRVNGVPAYSVYYSAVVGGQLMYGRDIMLLPDVPGVRDGVVIVMRAVPRSRTSPSVVGGSGVLQQPLRTFAFGA